MLNSVQKKLIISCLCFQVLNHITKNCCKCRFYCPTFYCPTLQSVSVFFPHTFYAFQFKFDYQSYSRFNIYYFDKFDKFVLFLNILTDYFAVSYCRVFLFCIYNFRMKSQFHVKWICRNKFIIIIIIIIAIIINMCNCFQPGYDFIHFDFGLIFLIRPFFLT